MKTLLLLLALVLAPLARAQTLDTCVAIRLRSHHAPGSSSIWGDNRKFWPQRAVIPVQFVGGSTGQRAAAWRRFQKIDRMVNLTFVRVQKDGVIRVAFDPNGGHWSYVGTDNRLIPYPKPTMNIALESGFLNSSTTEWNRVVYHEALHMAGFLHEHQHPGADVNWNISRVLSYYRQTQGWTDADIRFQVLNRATMNQYFSGTPWNPESIMQYPVDPWLTLDGRGIPWNAKMSKVDETFIQQTYPNP